MNTRALRYTFASISVALAAGCSANTASEPTGTSQSRITVCGQDTVHGMDISHYDGSIDWPTAKASGIAFAFAKATEGTGFTDPTFATNWAGMKSAGVVRGAYHFFHANVDPVAQANFVVQTVGVLEPGDLPIVLDLEVTDGQSEATVAANAKAFMDTVKAATGLTPIVYTSPAFLSDFSALTGDLLWVANWGVSCPNVPAPWSTWTFWQHTDMGTVPGVPAAAVDLDTFNGTLADLSALGGGGGTPDSGGAVDAGASADSGGTNPDAGAPPPKDGGSPDATTPHFDAGTLADAGAGGGGGAGHAGASGNPVADAPTGSSGGCAVARRAGAPASRLTAGLMMMALAGASLGRRRRARRDA